MSTNRDAATVIGAIRRGALRAAVFLGLVAVGLFLMRGETEAANRAFLWVLVGLCVAMFVWGVIESSREVRRLQSRSK